MYLVGWFYFPTLEKWPFVGDFLCSRGSSYEGCMGPSVVVDQLYGWSGMLGWPLVQLVTRPCLMRRLLPASWQGWSQGP